jgi:hypothetical protein
MKVQTNIPDSLYHQLEQLAQRESISLEQLIAIALSAQVSSWLMKDYIEEKAKQGDWEKFQAILSKAPDVKPPAYDSL